MYMADLLVICGKLPVNLTPRPNNIPGWSQIVTQMFAELRGRQLATHTDESFWEYLVDGPRSGFRIGFSHDFATCVSAVSNMSSAAEKPSVIDEFMTTELAAGRILGQVEPDSFHSIHINRFKMKGHTPGKWRLIVDISFPTEGNVNDGIDPGLFTPQWM